MIVITDTDTHDTVILGDTLEEALTRLAQEDSNTKIDEIRYLIKSKDEVRKWRR